MKNRKRRLMMSVVAVCMILAVILTAGGLYRYRSRQNTAGVRLTSQSLYETEGFPCYLQGDPAWSGDKLGDSRYSMGGSGCLTSCIAAGLSAQRMETDPTADAVTPGELNRLFSEAGVYNAEGDIVWKRIAKALPDTDVVVAAGVDNAEIEQLLSEGKYPIVRVKNHGGGAWHWVVLAGSDEKGYLCMDPLNKSQKLVPLSEHGDLVYSMRTVFWKN